MRVWACTILLYLLSGTLAVAQTTPAVPQLLLVDDECMVKGDHYKTVKNLGVNLKHKNSAAMKKRALSLTARPTNSQLLQLQKIDCILGIHDNPAVTVTGAPDLLVQQQQALVNFEHDPAEKIFYHPLFGIEHAVNIAVVDTGVERDHLDLEARMWTGPNGELGYDFINDDADPADDNGHGTHMAGLIGAQRLNGEGIRGVMGDFSKIMALKTQDSKGSGNVADVVNAIQWATANGADVINLSLAARGRNAAMEEAIKAALAKNIVVITASGNTKELIAPANFISPVGFGSELRGLMGVGSIDAVTSLSSDFSNTSPALVEITAPGSNAKAGIVSTFRGGGYATVDGTSASSAQVAGAAALAIGFMKSQGAPYTADSIEKFLEDSAVEDPALANSYLKGRKLNIKRLGTLLLNSTAISTTGGFDDK